MNKTIQKVILATAILGNFSGAFATQSIYDEEKNNAALPTFTWYKDKNIRRDFETLKTADWSLMSETEYANKKAYIEAQLHQFPWENRELRRTFVKLLSSAVDKDSKIPQSIKKILTSTMYRINTNVFGVSQNEALRRVFPSLSPEDQVKAVGASVLGRRISFSDPKKK